MINAIISEFNQCQAMVGERGNLSPVVWNGEQHERPPRLLLMSLGPDG